MSVLKKRVIVVTFIVWGIVALLVLLTVFNDNLEKNMAGERQSYLEEIRDNAIFTLKNELNHFSACLNNEARTISLLGDLSEQQLLTELKNFPKDASMPRAMVLMLDGKVYSSLSEQVKKYNPADFQETLQRRKGAIAQPRFSKSLNRQVVAISVPLYINQQYVGVLIGDYDIGAFDRIFATNFLDGSCAISLVQGDGLLISHTDVAAVPTELKENVFDFYLRDDVKFTEGSREQMQGDMQQGKSGYQAYLNQGLARYVSYAPVGVNGWYIAAASNDQTMTRQASLIKLDAFRFALGVFLIMLITAAGLLINRAREQRALQRVLEQMASTDALTKLFNKYATEQMIINYLNSDGADGLHALLMIDIDGFKYVNDCLGHVKGDEILAEFGADLKAIFQAADIIGRVGGDEFVVLIKNANGPLVDKKAGQICDVLRRIHTTQAGEGKTAETSASIGIAWYPQDGQSYDLLYRKADVALYASKNGGRDQYTFFEIQHHSPQLINL